MAFLFPEEEKDEENQPITLSRLDPDMDKMMYHIKYTMKQEIKDELREELKKEFEVESRENIPQFNSTRDFLEDEVFDIVETALSKSDKSSERDRIFNKILRGLDNDAEKGELERDFFNIMMITKPISWNNIEFFDYPLSIPMIDSTWVFGLIAYSIQLTLGGLLIYDQADKEFFDTTMSVPITVDTGLRVAQVMTIFLSVMTQNDLLIGLKTLLLLPPSEKESWRTTIGAETGNKYVWFMQIFLPNALKLFQGALILVATFFVIIQTDDIVDLLKDFSALFVISTVDDIFFFMADHGYFGGYLSKKAEELKEKKIKKENDDIKTYLMTAFISITTVLLIGWINITIGQGKGSYIRQKYPLCPFDSIFEGKSYLSIMRDGICQSKKGQGTNVLNCGWDGGDCLVLNERYPDCNVTDVSLLGDGNCNYGLYNTLKCGFDNGDCMDVNEEKKSRYSSCILTDYGILGNDVCDEGEYNTIECGFDDGDCGEICPLNDFSKINDTICDREQNTPECLYDGGDCVISMEPVGSAYNGSWKWEGAVLGPDGFMYGIPYDANRILKFDLSTFTSTLVGEDLGSECCKWVDGVELDGFLYGIPYKANSILKFDLESGNTTLIAEGHKLLSPGNFASGVLGPNGIIYFLPFAHNKVVKFDPKNELNPLIEMKEDLGNSLNFRGGVLGRDGNVYGIPFGASRVLKITVNEDTISFIGDEVQGDSKWRNGVLAQDGNIYACPYSQSTVLEINVQEQTTHMYYVDSEIEISKWSDFVESSDGVLYSIPYISDLILVFDPKSKTTMTISLDDNIKKKGNKKKWSTGVLAGDGHIYTLPYDEDEVFQIKPLQFRN